MVDPIPTCTGDGPGFEPDGLGRAGVDRAEAIYGERSRTERTGAPVDGEEDPLPPSNCPRRTREVIWNQQKSSKTNLKRT